MEFVLARTVRHQRRQSCRDRRAPKRHFCRPLLLAIGIDANRPQQRLILSHHRGDNDVERGSRSDTFVDFPAAIAKPESRRL